MTSSGRSSHVSKICETISRYSSFSSGFDYCIPFVSDSVCLDQADSKGPVFFRQKRIGIHRTTFEILKFRSMRTDTPRDTATHLLNNPDQWITRAGRFLRKTSLDELPQIYQVFTSRLSAIGPRPALWSQTDLIAEREKYGANDIKPGITGWAQINGRDELEIDVKARFDGEYAAALNAGKFKGLAMDVKCFFGTIVSVLKSDGVVEGGTGELKRQEETKREVINQ